MRAARDHSSAVVRRSKCSGVGRAQVDAATLHVLMLRRRSHRLTTTFLMVLSLLFSQLALANYVCPARADATAMAEMMASGQPCAGMDEAQSTLCHQHSTDAPQSFEAVKVPAPGLPAVVQVLELPLVLEAGEAPAVTTSSTAEKPPPDPLFLSTLRLRV